MVINNHLDLVKNISVSYDQDIDNLNIVNVTVEPLYKGYGITLGNALRRVLLSSIPGSSVCGIRISGVSHEYESIPGVKEDVIDILLNFKSLIIRLESDTKNVKFKIKGPLSLNAGMIPLDDDLKVINKDLHICTITSDTTLEFELYCAKGVGYVVSEENKNKSWPVGFIALDSVYSPVVNVSYDVESVRVGKFTNFDKLNMKVETNGVVDPKIAVNIAANILKEKFSLFDQFDIKDSVTVAKPLKKKENNVPFDPILLRRINDIDINIRAKNCLSSENIIYVGDLVIKSSKDLVNIPNFGARSLDEVSKWLKRFNLELKMDIPGWPPENLEELSNKYNEN